jgi:integrase
MARREYQNPPLKKSRAGRRFYFVRVRLKVLTNKGTIGTKQHRERLGFCDETGVREAERKRADYLKTINGQSYTVQSQIPFGEFAEVWRQKHVLKPENLGAGTQAKYEGHLDHHILPVFKDWKLCEIDTEVIDTFLGQKAAAGLSWWTRMDLRNILSSIFTKADDWGYWNGKRNPVERANVGKKRVKREKRILTDDQVKMLLAALPANVRLLVKLADSTGMRISEILGLRWKNVEMEKGWIMVRERYYRGDQDVTKSEKSIRDLPLGYLADDFRSLKPAGVSGEGFVFDRGDGKPYDDRGLLQHFIRPAAVALGFYFEGFGFHSFRRENNTKMQEEGASAIEAQRHLGHSRTEMTAEYTVLQRQRHEDMVKRVQDRWIN